MKNVFPQSIQAGVTFNRSVTLADYPASLWALSAHLRGPSVINLAATADGDNHVFTAPVVTTAAWQPGVHSYTVRAQHRLSGDVDQVEISTLEILADLAALDGAADLRTHAQRTLDAIEAVIEKRATKDQERYSINNRELWRTPITDLLKLRNTYRAEVRRERASKRGKSLWGPAAQARF